MMKDVRMITKDTLYTRASTLEELKSVNLIAMEYDYNSILNTAFLGNEKIKNLGITVFDENHNKYIRVNNKYEYIGEIDPNSPQIIFPVVDLSKTKFDVKNINTNVLFGNTFHNPFIHKTNMFTNENFLKTVTEKCLSKFKIYDGIYCYELDKKIIDNWNNPTYLTYYYLSNKEIKNNLKKYINYYPSILTNDKYNHMIWIKEILNWIHLPKFNSFICTTFFTTGIKLELHEATYGLNRYDSIEISLNNNEPMVLKNVNTDNEMEKLYIKASKLIEKQNFYDMKPSDNIVSKLLNEQNFEKGQYYYFEDNSTKQLILNENEEITFEVNFNHFDISVKVKPDWLETLNALCSKRRDKYINLVIDYNEDMPSSRLKEIETIIKTHTVQNIWNLPDNCSIIVKTHSKNIAEFLKNSNNLTFSYVDNTFKKKFSDIDELYVSVVYPDKKRVKITENIIDTFNDTRDDKDYIILEYGNEKIKGPLKEKINRYNTYTDDFKKVLIDIDRDETEKLVRQRITKK